MGFFHDMEQAYGAEATALLRAYNRNLPRLASLKNRRIFLLKCRKHGFYPNHILNRTQSFSQVFEYHDARSGQLVRNFNSRLVHRILSMEISITIKNLTFLIQRQEKLKADIRGVFPEGIWWEFDHRCSFKYRKAFHRIQDTHIRKFSRIEREQAVQISTKSTWFKNISETEIPDDITRFLALGPKFSIAPTFRDISIPRILAEIESAPFDDQLNNKTLITAKVTNILTNWAQNKQGFTGPLQATFNKTKKFLKEHPELIISPADKGNVTVCMNKSVYLELSNSILMDREYYTELARDPTSTIQQKANQLVSNLKKAKMLDDTLTNRLTIYNSRPARFYGLPKIHKPQLALRPIISSLQCPNSKIAQLVTDILTKAYDKDNSYYVTDSFQFASFINNFELPENFVLVSLDVTSLFTNIPLQLVTDSIKKRWPKIRQHTDISEDKFIDLVSFVFDTTYFTFQNKFYRQIFGTPMGSVVSPIAAQYVMDDFLDGCLPKLPFHMPFIKKYVDDIICAVPHDSIESTLTLFNSIHHRLKFTIERETNNAVPFLDTSVVRDGRTIRTDWYTKPTASGRYINYHSYHATRMKINVVLNMRNRILQVSHPIYKLNNLKKLFDIMRQNSFPATLLNKLLYSTPASEPRRTRSHLPNADIDLSPVTPRYRTLPYDESLTFRLISALSGVPGLKIALRNNTTIRSLFTSLKDKTPLLLQSNVVYSIPCNDCSQVYIGQTSRTLKARITSHKSDTRTKKTTCQLSRHSNDLKHTMNFEDIKILDSEQNFKKRTFLEMVRITQAENSMNSRRDIEGLSNIYTYLLKIDKDCITRRDTDEVADLTL